MKLFISICLILAALSTAKATEAESKNMMILQSWNEANNAKDAHTLSRLYASEITYYGSKLSQDKCIKDKKRFFKKYPYFSQKIKNPNYVTLTPRLHKVSFEKHVQLNPSGKIKMYPSYLLIDTSTSFPTIVEEGDKITDTNIERKHKSPTYSFSGIHSLTGYIEEVQHYGPPGYGEDPKHDKKLTAYILKLDDPIKVIEKDPNELNFTTTISEVQLVVHDFSIFNKARKDHQKLIIKGEFFSSHTGYHIRDLLMDIKTIKPYSPQTNNQKSVASTVPKCTYFTVTDIKQLNIRNKPGKPSRIVGRVNNGDSVCIYEFSGKWGRTDRGWLSRKYLSKDVVKNNFLLSDIDKDGKKERLEWKCFSGCSLDAGGAFYQLKLYDDDGTLLWTGSRDRNADDLVGFMGDSPTNLPLVLQDIDGDGNTELIMGGWGNEAYVTTFNIYRWNGKAFLKNQNSSRFLIWDGARSKSNTLKWSKPYKHYDKKVTIWWIANLEASINDDLPIAEIIGVKYPNMEIIMNTKKAKIRFTPAGAVIEGWVK